MIQRLAAATVALFCLCLPAAAQNTGFTPEQAVSYCITDTRSPGTYTLLSTAPVPRVGIGAGGTNRGAATVNDCLLDVYEIQYGGQVQSAALNGASPQEAAELECRQIRDRRVIGSIAAVVGYAVGLGDSLNIGAAIGGGIGVAYSAQRATQNYKACIAAATQPQNQIFAVYSCTAGASALQGGSGYCRRR